MEFREQYGPWALIVGGSEGLGSAFAAQLLDKGLDVFLVARTAHRLDALAEGLRTRYPNRQIRTLAADLSETSGGEAVIAAARDLEIGLLIYNAGACHERRAFVDMDLDFNMRLATLNVLNKMRLVRAFGPQMRDRERGGIMLVGSGAYAAGVSGFSTYSGSKAFGTLFSEGIWHELKPYGVHVLAYVVSSVATPAMARNYPVSAGKGADPEEVARYGLTQLANGPVAWSPGGEPRIRALMAMPRDEAVELVYQQSAPLYPERERTA
jgi:short-subunit dehydrogenase